MIRPFTLCPLAAVVCVAGASVPASAQLPVRPQPQAITEVAVVPQADLHGTVLDDRNAPLAGAGVSAPGPCPSGSLSAP